MLDKDKRKSIYLLHEQGIGSREIGRIFEVSINTVSAIISQKGEMPDSIRKDKIQIDIELLKRLHRECET